MDEKRSPRTVRIWLAPPVPMAGPMGTAIISRVPTYRVQRDDWEKSVFCTVSRLARNLAACGMSEAGIAAAVKKAVALENPDTILEIEIS